ncbi:hypothetical protein VTK73DRAFT_3808 [Phialemonium thermophilum]|uniref:Proteasome inhibitor PI31 subunit n=1 Tax=Phialemonium thermophilum TaxID=223376 RepID=A0ABR3WXU3_9PEZI
MASNPLSPLAISKEMADALPTHDAQDPTSDLSSSLEAIALFAHACMKSLGFRLVGFDEEKKTEAECSRLAPRLPPNWNQGLNSHCFVYAHTQSSMQFVIRVDRLGGKAEIRGLAVGHERIVRVEIAPRDYVSSSALPLRIPRADNGSEDRSDLQERLKKVFISEERMNDLANLLKINIIQKLIPSLQKEGYEETPERGGVPAGGEVGDSSQPPRPEQPRLPQPELPRPPYPAIDPLADVPRRPVPAGDFPPPGFEDEYEINRPPRGPLHPGGGGMPGVGEPFGGGRNPYNIGERDLYPPGLAPHDPLRGSFVPGGPGGADRGTGGMHPTFDDPLFGGPHGDDTDDPRIPPGARWDPVGPGGLPRLGGRRRGGGFGDGSFGGGLGGSFGGDII